jgi:tetratricopeptide (TPR) repeat protein
VTAAGPHIRLAQQQLRIGNPGGAMEQLRRALGAAPDDGLAHALLALCLNDTRRLQAAAHEARLALSLAPELPTAHLAAGIVATNQRHFRAAERHLTQARALNPADSVTLRWLARLYGATDRRRLVGPMLEEALSHDPEDADILADLGWHYLEQNDLAAAARQAAEALYVDPECAGANVLQGHVLLRRGDIAAAREHALLALRNDAGHEPGLRLMCHIKMRENPLLGLWWRYSVWVGGFGGTRTIAVLIGMFLAYAFGAQLLFDAGQRTLAGSLTYVWLGFCLYTWVGAGWFEKAVRKELASVRLRGDF